MSHTLCTKQGAARLNHLQAQSNRALARDRATRGPQASAGAKRLVRALTILSTLALASFNVTGCGDDSTSNGASEDQPDNNAADSGTPGDPNNAADAATPEDTSSPEDEPDPVADASPQEDTGEGTDATVEEDAVTPPIDPDLNEDGTLNILVLGTTRSIQFGADPFSPNQVAAQLQNILDADDAVSTEVNVVAEDIYRSAPVTIGLGQAGQEFTWDHASHSLTQYYHWPDGLEARMEKLAGRGEVDWDHVVIGADPHIVATLPGYYALGANMIADKVAEGDAQPHLLMLWSKDDDAIDRFAEHTLRTSHRARTSLPTIAAGRAWGALPQGKRDSDAAHPTPNGAYLAAAAIYAHLFERSAANSGYTYDDEIAQVAHDTLANPTDDAAQLGPRTFTSPFKGCDIPDRALVYNHTGTSSERGILDGFRWVLGKARVELRNGGPAPIHFNYGRANTNFEPNKRYQVDPARFDFSLGFPMQDNGNHGDLSMLYGLDHRFSDAENGTDLGVARYMVNQGELPQARAVPIRTLYAQLKETIPTASAFRDPWHMSRNLDRATGAFMYTLLTGHCALDEEPEDRDSDPWRQWTAHRIGYETAWSLMHLSGVAPCFKVLPDAVDSVSVSPEQSAGLAISFANVAPDAEVTVTLSTNNDGAVTISPSTLVFTPENHAEAQVVTMTGLDGEAPTEVFIVTARTESSDPGFDGLEDRWEYTVIRD